MADSKGNHKDAVNDTERSLEKAGSPSSETAVHPVDRMIADIETILDQAAAGELSMDAVFDEFPKTLRDPSNPWSVDVGAKRKLMASLLLLSLFEGRGYDCGGDWR